MSHEAQRNFCLAVKRRFPTAFERKVVLDIGSLDINGSNKEFFTNCQYTGIDVLEGKNVDVVSLGHEFDPGHQFDTIISTECFEHDCYFPLTIQNVIKLLKPKGMFVFTAGGFGRGEHGTLRTTKRNAPGLEQNPKMDPNYYRNVYMNEFSQIDFMEQIFSAFGIEYDSHFQDIRFWGIKR